MIRVHLLEPDYWRRRGLAAVVADCGYLEVCDDWSSADVVLIALHALVERGSPPVTAPLLAYGEEDCPRKAAGALTHGAHGYFALSSDPATLRTALEVVSSGRIWAPRDAVPFLTNASATEDVDPRQLEVLRLLHEGLTNKEIANRLGLAEATVKARMNRLYKRFRVSTRLQLLAIALRQRIIRDEKM